MESNSIVQLLKNAKKKTLVKAFIQGRLSEIDFGEASKVIHFGDGGIVIGDWGDIKAAIDQHSDIISDYFIETDRRNSLIDLLDIKEINARIEPGAIIREGVIIEDDAVVMMGACVNIGAHIGEKTMIDMNAVIGGGAKIGKRCHIGAGVVIKGVISSPTASPVIIEDDVIIGPNAVIMESVTIGKGAIIRAGVVVTKNVRNGEVL
ncbi:2,3,4,5-tetrahydropyridine-2,6-dicarboxylate N-acetyltransferase [Bacillus sp. T3]|uniref:2,3,4,5-tetrahydropyridine-2,6-dicarboxylate N-acetyltransferase n=1 Tax=Bacillus sp. T3 TaxID=467262 RepID=UPI002980D611|nr:2,3,4,5-tetrahydropyridine-2,6-dicarboxylate N-acetyltransferase [Bacillus sp. T3]